MSAKRREDPPWIELERWLEATRASESWPALWLVRGEERYFQRKAFEALSAAVREQGAELSVHDGSDPDFQLPTLLSDLATPSMFHERQCIVVRGVDGQLKKSGKKDSPLAAGLLAFLARGEQGRSVALFANSLRADHALAKRATAEGFPMLNARKLWDTPPPWRPDPRQAELVLWLGVLARKAKVRLSPDDAVWLVRCVGNDLGALESELEALAKRGPGAERGDVGFQAAGSPFAVADRMLGGGTQAALVGLEGLYRAGMSGRDGERTLDGGAIGALLLRALTSGARQGLAASTALASGASPEEAAEAAGAGGARQRTALLDRVRAQPDALLWAERLEQLAELERRQKSGQGIGRDDWARLALTWALQKRVQA